MDEDRKKALMDNFVSNVEMSIKDYQSSLTPSHVSIALSFVLVNVVSENLVEGLDIEDALRDIVMHALDVVRSGK